MMIRSTCEERAVLRPENVNNSKSSNNNRPLSRWQPDVYVQSFVPKAFTAINQCPATPVSTPPLDGIDFQEYVASLYGQKFQTPLPTSRVSIWDHSISTNSLEQLNAQTYEGHFQRCLMLDAQAQEHDIRSFDIFGAKLVCLDPVEAVFTLPVPGLREDSPAVNFGDKVILRQWIEGPSGPLKLGLHGWLPYSQDSPGFTGYAISAVVMGVNKTANVLHIRAFGMFDLPQVKCNVMFVKQIRFLQSLRMAVVDVANELRELRTNDSNPNRSDKAAMPALEHVHTASHSPPISTTRSNW